MKQVIVLIGAGAIGQAIARRISAGKQLLLADRNQTKADEAAKKPVLAILIQSTGG